MTVLKEIKQDLISIREWNFSGHENSQSHLRLKPSKKRN